MAQWQWVDKDGRKVFSDTAPPAGVPEKNILKRPSGARAADAGAAAAAPAPGPAAAASGAAPGSKPMLSGKDPALEAKRKQAEDAEAAAKKAAEDKLAAQRADNCTLARKGLDTYNSGQRVATLNAKGEREIMDDKARAAEVTRLKAVVASDCSSNF